MPEYEYATVSAEGRAYPYRLEAQFPRDLEVVVCAACGNVVAADKTEIHDQVHAQLEAAQ